jgi:hypothetical protein
MYHMRNQVSFLLLSLFAGAILISFGPSARAQSTAQPNFIPAGFTFQSNLKYGDTRYPDVNYLQYLLDQDERTRVAATGTGSAGNTSSYFGAKTMSAVSRFQSLYTNEVLTPAGLSQPTGFFGAASRAKANNILAGMKSVATSTARIIPQPASSTMSVVKGSPAAALVMPGGLNARDNELIGRVSDKVDKQTSHVADATKRKIVKDNIIAKFKSDILKTKLQAYLNATGLKVAVTGSAPTVDAAHYAFKEGSWNQFTGSLKNVFSASVAYAADLPASLEKAGRPIAQSNGDELPFGGEFLVDIPCTCSIEDLNYILDYVDDSVLALLYTPGESVLYLNYDIYGVSQLGTYTPSANDCQIEAGTDCISITPDGGYGMLPGTGTSDATKNSTLCMRS